MRFSLVLLFLGFLAVGCTSSGDQSNRDDASPNGNESLLAIPAEPIGELTPEQEQALDALDTFQMNTDESGRVYSTFAGLEQPFYPPDTVLTISQTELLQAMKQYVELHCTDISAETRSKLASHAAMAQEEYTLAICTEGYEDLSFEEGLPMTGIWVMLNVLGTRDVVLVW
ncbi:MAG: hypothetical protein HWE24_07360 [Oceanospirillaceae bacterium]|nr:hypothetical protein [Oceanospirillaceae bacterium]